MATDLTWDAARMAKFIDLTPRRLRQLVDEGVIPKHPDRGRYNPFVVNVAYIRWLRDQRAKVEPTEDDTLSREAKAARQRQQIDEAEMLKNERQVQEGQLAYVSHMREFVADITTRFVQLIKQSALREPEKRQWINEIAGLKFEPTKMIPFQK